MKLRGHHMAGLDLAQLQEVPRPPVNWTAVLEGNRLVSQEMEVDGLHYDAISFSGGMYSRRGPRMFWNPKLHSVRARIS